MKAKDSLIYLVIILTILMIRLKTTAQWFAPVGFCDTDVFYKFE